MFEYDNGVMVCKEHGTPAQKDENGFWCLKCEADDKKTNDIVVKHFI